MKHVAKVMGYILITTALGGCAFVSPNQIVTATPQPSITATVTITPSPTATFIPITPAVAGTVIANTVQQINAENAERITSLARWGDGTVGDTKYTSDGKYLVVATAMGVYIYSTENYSLLKYIDTDTPILNIAISPDNRLVAASTLDKVLIYDIETGSFGRAIGVITSSISFSPSGNMLATGTNDGLLQLWNANDGTLFRSFEKNGDFINTIAFSLDERFIATGGYATTIWNLDGTMLNTQGPYVSGGGTSSLVFSPDGKLLAESADGLRLWRVLDNGRLIIYRTIPLGNIQITPVIDISPDGKYLAAGTTQGLFVWNIASGVVVHKIRADWFFPTGISWLSDNKTIALSSAERGLEVWSLEDTEPLYKFHELSGIIKTLDWSSDGRRIASGTKEGNIFVLDSQSGKTIFMIREKPEINSISFMPDTNLLAVGFENQTVEILNQDGVLNKSLQGSSGCCNVYLAFSPDGKLLAANLSGDDYSIESIQFWNIKNWSITKTLNLEGDKRYIYGIKFSPGGDFIATTELYNPNIVIRNINDLTVVQELKLPDKGMRTFTNGFSYSPNGEFIASGSEEGPSESRYLAVKLWKIGDEKLVYEINDILLKDRRGFATLEIPNIVAWTPDGTAFAVGMPNGNVRIVRANDGKTLSELIGHTLWVTAVVFSPDGRFLASGSIDGTIRLWGIK